MSKINASWALNYQDTPQFVKENDAQKTRTINQEYIPTERFNKDTVMGQLKKKPEIIKFHKLFVYSDPVEIFNTIVKDSRNTLPANHVMMKDVNTYYVEKLNVNMYNIYKHSAKFFSDVFFKKENGQYVVNQSNFTLYEKYIYLLSLLVLVFRKREEFDAKMDRDFDEVINWVQARYSDSLVNILNGPLDSYDTPDNFIEHYNVLISSASSIENVVDNALLSKVNTLYNELANFKASFKNMDNSYVKEYDNARQYNIVIFDSTNLTTTIDKIGNLVFDGNYIDIGDVGNKGIIAEYNSLIVKQNIEENPPQKTLAKQFQLLFNNYSTLTVQELSFNYHMYMVDLSRISCVFLVFPGIITIQHTIYDKNGPGTLMIAGRFEKNEDLNRYIFKPNEECLSFIGSQTFVKSFSFYIMTQSGIIPGSSLTLNYTQNEIFNHVLSTNKILSISDVNNEILIPTENISFSIQQIENITLNEFNKFIDNIIKLFYDNNVFYNEKYYLNNTNFVTLFNSKNFPTIKTILEKILLDFRQKCPCFIKLKHYKRTLSGFGVIRQGNMFNLTFDINTAVYLKIPDDNNNPNVLIRFYHDYETPILKHNHTFVYNPYLSIVQSVPFNLDNVKQLSNIYYTLIYNTETDNTTLFDEMFGYLYVDVGDIMCLTYCPNFILRTTDNPSVIEYHGDDNYFIAYLDGSIDTNLIPTDNKYTIETYTVTVDGQNFIITDQYNSSVTNNTFTCTTKPQSSLDYFVALTDNENLIEKYADAQSSSNYFRAFYVTDNLYERYWDVNTYITGIVINPLNTIGTENINGNIMISKDASTIIYTINGNKKTFYNLLMIFNNKLFLDNNETNDIAYVYKYNNITLTNNEYNELSNLDIVLTNGGLSFTIISDGTILNINNTQVTVASIDNNKKYVLKTDPKYFVLFSCEILTISSTKYITNIILNVVYSELYSYDITNNTKTYYTHMTTNISPFYNLMINNTTPLSMNYVKTEIQTYNITNIQYYQRNLDNPIYTTNEKIQMVINNKTNVYAGQRLRLYGNDISQEQYMKNKPSLAESIPSKDLYVSETVNNKIVVYGVNNSEDVSKVVIKSNSGQATITENNNIHLSLNFK